MVSKNLVLVFLLTVSKLVTISLLQFRTICSPNQTNKIHLGYSLLYKVI